MKKFLSIILSVIMVFSVGLASTSVAMAKTYSSQETKKPGYSTIKVEVNGKPSTDVTYDVDNHIQTKCLSNITATASFSVGNSRI